MIIDAHNRPDWHGHDLAKFLANMDANGIDVTWLLSWEAPADEVDPTFTHVVPGGGEGAPVPFARCLSYVERAPGRTTVRFSPLERRAMTVEVFDDGQPVLDESVAFEPMRTWTRSTPKPRRR